MSSLEVVTTTRFQIRHSLNTRSDTIYVTLPATNTRKYFFQIASWGSWASTPNNQLEQSSKAPGHRFYDFSRQKSTNRKSQRVLDTSR